MKKLAGIKFQSEIGTVSGIWTTTARNMYLAARRIDKLGFVASKSIGPEPRPGNYPPIIDQLDYDKFQNAVGLSNPGDEIAAAEFAEIYPLPNNVRLVVSIFGGNEYEFVKVGRKMNDCCDAIELNVSCPHADGCGAAIGVNPELVYKMTKAVVKTVDVPVIDKLTPLAEDISAVALAALEGGAAMISGMNTWGPEKSDYLTAGKGGISGPNIKDKGLKKLEEVRKAVGPKVPIIGMGGVTSADDARDFLKVVDLVGVGSAVIGMHTNEKIQYYNAMVSDIENGTNNAAKLLPKHPVIRHEPYEITEIIHHAPDLYSFIFDRKIAAQPCQYVFAQIPKSDMRPFSIADDDPLTLTVKKVGNFTGRMFELKEGDRMEIWGTYGNPIPIDAGSRDNWIVGGGTMIAPMHFLSKNMSAMELPTNAFIGAKTADELLYFSKFNKYTLTSVSTDDGSAGHHGFVTELFEKSLQKIIPGAIYIGGPEIMMVKALEILSKYAPHKLPKSYFLVERYTKCGCGACGSCSIDGYDACRGYMTGNFLIGSKEFGVKKLDSAGRKISI